MALTPEQFLALGLDPALIFKAVDYQPDPWQQDLLRSNHPRVLLCCSRQAGKSTTVAALAIHQAQQLQPPGVPLSAPAAGDCQPVRAWTWSDDRDSEGTFRAIPV